MVRGKTNQEDYRWLLKRKFLRLIFESLVRVGKAYTIRRDSFGSYCKVQADIKSNHFQLLNATQDLLAGNKRAQGSYLAVANIAQAFPQLQAEVCLKSLIVEG